MAKYPRTRKYGEKRNQPPKYAHRVIAEVKLGRALEAQEVVHHRDGNRFNNDPENLVVLPSQSEHARLENWERKIKGLEPLFERCLPEFEEVKR
ncbi:MAG: hypothetical protein RLZZ156_1412 [Deinococcota bacterium]|jgi:hypothetical protein